MATATKSIKSAIVTKLVPVEFVEDKSTYNLELSVEEANVLRAVLGYITGCTETSRRGLTTNIYKALSNAGVPFLMNGDLSGELAFKSGRLVEGKFTPDKQ